MVSHAIPHIRCAQEQGLRAVGIASLIKYGTLWWVCLSDAMHSQLKYMAIIHYTEFLPSLRVVAKKYGLFTGWLRDTAPWLGEASASEHGIPCSSATPPQLCDTMAHERARSGRVAGVWGLEPSASRPKRWYRWIASGPQYDHACRFCMGVSVCF